MAIKLFPNKETQIRIAEAIENLKITGGGGSGGGPVDWADIENKPELFSKDYDDLTNKPDLKVVATTGSYNDLLNKPDLFSKDYNDLTNKPTIPTKASDLTNDTGYITGYTETDPIFTAWDKSTGISITKSQVSDLIEATQALSGLMSTTDKQRLDALHALLEEDTENNVVDSINEVLAIFNNYPEGADLVTVLAGKVDKVTDKGLSTNDLTNTLKSNYDTAYTHSQTAHAPSNAEANVNADWNANSGAAQILNKPKLTTVATSGSYNDLDNLPDLFSGDYEDLINKPEFQDKLTAGNNITIDPITNVISGSAYQLTKYKIEQALKGYVDHSLQLGSGASAGFSSTALGESAGASGSGSIALGRSSSTTKNSSIAIGDGAKAQGLNSIAIGKDTIVTEDYVADFGSIRQVRVNETPVNDRDATSKKYVDDKDTIKEQNNNNNIKFWTGSQAEYDSLSVKDEDTIYFIEEE